MRDTLAALAILALTLGAVALACIGSAALPF